MPVGSARFGGVFRRWLHGLGSEQRARFASCLRFILVPLAVTLTLLSWSSDSHAYAWMIKHGYGKCGSCHTDPSGGETLTGMGRVQADTLLSMRGSDKSPREMAKFLWGVNEPGPLRLGGSSRWMFIKQGDDTSFFPMQLDVYGAGNLGGFLFGGSLGMSKVDVGSPHARRAQVTSGQDDGANLLSRTHYIGMELDNGSMIRVGRLNLPFGLRIPEHVMWVRDATRTDRDSDQQHGVSLFMNDGPWRGELMAIFGNYQIAPDDFRERGYAGYFEYFLNPTFAIGVSSMFTQARQDLAEPLAGRYNRHAHGVMARAGITDSLAVLGEADVLKLTKHAIGYVGLLQVDYELFQGIHLMGTGELRDVGQPSGGDPTPGSGELLMGAWVSAGWYFLSHFDLRVEMVSRQESPMSIQAQLHTFF